MFNYIKKLISIAIVFILFVNISIPCIFAYEDVEEAENIEKIQDINEKDKTENIEEIDQVTEIKGNQEENNNEENTVEINEDEDEVEVEVEDKDKDKEKQSNIDNDLTNEGSVTNQNNETNDEIEESEKEEIKLTYTTHVQNKGWQEDVNNNEIAGTEGEGLRLEALRIHLETELEGTIQYSTHIQNIGWQGFVNDGEVSGTTGQSYRLEALKIKLTGELAQKYDIYYRTHIQNLGWLEWAKNGEEAGTQNYSYRMEAIQINLVEKDTPISTLGKAFLNKPQINYRTHIQDIGWQGYVKNGSSSGTIGMAKRLEAIKINLGSSNITGSIQYKTHIQDIGWQDYVDNNKLSGTEGRSLRLEAIKIKLTGELTEYFDIYYRTHVENMGWLAWAKNGEEAGTEGYAYRLEAIQIKIVPKNEEAPGNTRGHFYNKALEKKSIEGIKLVFGDVCAGVDVSVHNGNIDWQKVKNVADFAIIRCGYGQDYSYQDDEKFEANMQGCIRNNIPVEVYLYSYADSEGRASSEAEHVMRLCNKYKKNIRKIWYDVEDNSVFNQIVDGTLSKEKMGQIIDTFSNKLKKSGYKVGLYTYSYALNNYLPSNINNKYDIWIANYPGTAKDIFDATYASFKTIYEMWQFTSSGIVNGISGNVDLNIRF